MITDDAIKLHFPSLENRIYLNSAAEGIPPESVISALAQYAEDKLLGMDGRKLHELQWESTQDQASQILGLKKEEVSFCSCSSEAYNLASLALNFQDGDEVIINDLDFPAGATPWLQPTCPAEVKVWYSRDGVLRIEDLVPLLSSKTRLVTTSLVSFFNGFKIDLKSLVETVHKNSDSLIALDVTQALGRIPLDLTGIDLGISSTHKWILASHGGGIVGIPSKRSEEFTTHAGGWFNSENAFDSDRFTKATSKPGAASFSVGMPNYPAIYAINAGLEFVQSFGIQNIDEYCEPIMNYFLEEVSKLNIELLAPYDPDHRAGIIAFRHPEADRIYQALHKENIHIMSHAGRLRIAIHAYNRLSDIERCLEILHEHIT